MFSGQRLYTLFASPTVARIPNGFLITCHGATRCSLIGDARALATAPPSSAHCELQKGETFVPILPPPCMRTDFDGQLHEEPETRVRATLRRLAVSALRSRVSQPGVDELCVNIVESVRGGALPPLVVPLLCTVARRIAGFTVTVGGRRRPAGPRERALAGHTVVLGSGGERRHVRAER